jgi:prepilin-type N-terminal cleavage/methylation domain-containing protein
MHPPVPRRAGFTLIELLIVVAIIAILAAIAVPNFLEAQTRSKVSRVKSDLRTFGTAIEAYSVDWNVPPPSAGEGKALGALAPLTLFGQNNQTGLLTPAITTPVAYVTNFIVLDPFMDASRAARADTRLFTYHTYTYRWPKNFPPRPDSIAIDSNEGAQLNGFKFAELYGNWRILSVGPDQIYSNDFTRPNSFSDVNVGLPYDPSNGTVSTGNIVRSQKEGEQTKFLNF